MSVYSSWREDAACAGRAPLWDSYVHGETSEEKEARHHRAKSVCRNCPVAGDCADDARPGRDEGLRNGVELPPILPWTGSGRRLTKALREAAESVDGIAS